MKKISIEKGNEKFISLIELEKKKRKNISQIIDT